MRGFTPSILLFAYYNAFLVLVALNARLLSGVGYGECLHLAGERAGGLSTLYIGLSHPVFLILYPVGVWIAGRLAKDQLKRQAVWATAGLCSVVLLTVSTAATLKIFWIMYPWNDFSLWLGNFRIGSW
jgi:hypothetical protein